MKILKLIKNRENIDPELETTIQKGKWYHYSRICFVKSGTESAIASLNIFERALASLSKIVHLDYKQFAVKRAIQGMREKEITNTTQAILSSTMSTSVEPRQEPQASSLFPIEEPVPSRPIYLSFSAYRQEREDRGEPVDLIVGRGTQLEARQATQKLTEQRYFRGTENKPYHPYTIDINPDLRPDYKAAIDNLKEMAYFPDESVDDIYVERIFPTTILQDMRLFVNAARILKTGGTLLADFNDGRRSEEVRKKQVEIWQAIFDEYQIPFDIQADLNNTHARSELNSQKFVCTKKADFDPTFIMYKGRLGQATLKLKGLFRENKLNF